jgi:lipopolysaccharide transport system ATP-binding protein
VPAAIDITSVGKQYAIGTGSATLSERVGHALRHPASVLRREQRERIWALRDVSATIEAGEAVGLVGRNGAGKTTLLRLLSRITPPTEGRIVLNGRVGSLLEVGTGFHPELSGRENVYLNGTILGMRRREISARYEEIVEFAGIEKFMETPVKRYSSGMYVRLAFAVAAHLEPEILLVDEVLAVGDLEFQRRCIGKMQDVTGEGRTVVFVSHNANVLQRLCERAILIEDGTVAMDGPTEVVVASYLGHGEGAAEEGVTAVPDHAERNGTAEARLRRVTMTDLDARPIGAVRLGQDFIVQADFEVFEPVADACFEVGISSFDGQQLVTAQSIDGGRPPVMLEPGMRRITVELPVTLLPHEYNLDIAVHRSDGNTVDHVLGCHRFSALNIPVIPGDEYRWQTVRGYVRPQSRWSAVTAVGPLGGTDPLVADAEPATQARR